MTRFRISDDQRRQAEGSIQMAIRRMASDYVFHARILERFQLRERTTMATMGVMAADTGIILLFNTEFVLSLPMDQLVGVLLHEVHHVLFRHIFSDPEDFPDEWARIVAEEVTVNEFVKKYPLPDGVILLEQFPQLPEMESTSTRYRRLRDVTERFPLISPMQWAVAESGSADSTSKAQKSAGGVSVGRIVDDHDVWKNGSVSQDEADAQVERILQEACVAAGAENIPDYLHETLRSWGIGNRPGAGREGLSRNRTGQLDWRRLLRRYIGRLRLLRPVFTRPPRRFPDLVGVLPGRRRQAGRPNVIAVIDTSASLSTAMLEDISGELARLARDYEVTVVECDCEIHDVYRYRPITEVAGRGGTDFRPPLEPTFLRRHRADVVVYFTDGQGPAPDEAPGVPLVWCLTADGQTPADWGRVIRMHTHG